MPETEPKSICKLRKMYRYKGVFKMLPKSKMFSKNLLWPGTISERHYNLFDKDVNTAELLNVSGF